MLGITRYDGCYATKQNNLRSWLRVQVIMIMIDEESVGETSVIYERSVCKVHSDGTLVLDKPVVFVFNNEDAVYFQCKVNEFCFLINRTIDVEYKIVPHSNDMSGFVKYVRIDPCTIDELIQRNISAKIILAGSSHLS